MISLNNRNAQCGGFSPCRLRLLGVILFALWLAGCASVSSPPIDPIDRADIRLQDSLVTSTTRGAVIEQILAAELASVRGDADRASALYAEISDLITDPAVLGRAVELALFAERPARARTLAARWVGLAPESGEALQLLGVLQLRDGEVETSIATLRRSLLAAPADREMALAQLGALLMDEALQDHSLAVMAAIAADYPDSNAAQLALARIALAQRSPEVALDAVDRVLAREPDWVTARLLRIDVLLALRRVPAALDAFALLLEQTPDNTALRREYALTLLELERDAEALAVYRELIATGDDHPRVLSNTAILAMDAGETALAMRALEQLRTRHPAFEARARLLEGGFLRSQGALAQSLAVFDRAIAAHPDDLELRYGRAMTQVMRNDIEAAEQDLRHILTAQPNDARALNALGYTLVDQTDRVEEGAALIERAYALEPQDPAIIDSMGWAAFREGDLQAALGYLQLAYERLPEDAEIAAHLGEVLWMLGRREQARAIWSQAQEHDASHPVLLETLQRLDP